MLHRFLTRVFFFFFELSTLSYTVNPSSFNWFPNPRSPQKLFQFDIQKPLILLWGARIVERCLGSDEDTQKVVDSTCYTGHTIVVPGAVPGAESNQSEVAACSGKKLKVLVPLCFPDWQVYFGCWNVENWFRIKHWLWTNPWTGEEE